MYAKLTFRKHLYQQNVQNCKSAKNLPVKICYLKVCCIQLLFTISEFMAVNLRGRGRSTEVKVAYVAIDVVEQ